MATYKILDSAGGNVINTIRASEAYVAARYAHYELMEEPAKSFGTKITPLALQRRFTQAERKAIRTAGKSNDDVQDFIELCKIAREINLTDPDTVTGVQAMESAGLLDPGRADEILQAPVQRNELP